MTTEDTEDTEAATPETDGAERMAFAGEYMVPTEVARRLERERDDAREDLEEEKAFHHRTHAELVQNQCRLQDVIRERDEAREELRTLAEHYATCNLELREKLDEAIELLRKALEAGK